MAEIERNAVLGHEMVKKGLGVLGKHPILLNHSYLELKLPAGDISNIDILENFPNLMYVNMAKNKVMDLRVLQNLPSLVQLDASNNELTECLDFTLAQCTSDNAWSDGDTALGSMLTLANLSFNKIETLPDLSHHFHLEVLMLTNNSISSIQGLSALKFLNVLDLSNNKLTSIQGLDNLPIQELNLGGNAIASLEGLEKLARLSSLNISKNDIMSLSALKDCTQLRVLTACDNRIVYIRQTEFLSGLPWLGVLELMGNPCSRKQYYRRRVLFRLPKLERLDKSNVSPEEMIETANLYGLEAGGDVAERAAVFSKHYPHDQFEVHGPFFMDDEDGVTEEQLLEKYEFRDHLTEEDIRSHARKQSTKFVGDSLMSAMLGGSGSQVTGLPEKEVEIDEGEGEMKEGAAEGPLQTPEESEAAVPQGEEK